jgi:hypothetical protein
MNHLGPTPESFEIFMKVDLMIFSFIAFLRVIILSQLEHFVILPSVSKIVIHLNGLIGTGFPLSSCHEKLSQEVPQN